MILIITNKEDVHPTPVIEEFNRRGAKFFRFNTEALLTDYDFCWWNDENHCDFVIHDKLSGKTVKGSEITAVWDRRPDKPSELPFYSTENIDNHCLKEGIGFLKYLRAYIKDIPSVGNIVMDNFAESKMLQINVAQKVGFNVPTTVFSNRKEDFTELANNYNTLVIKSIGNDSIFIEDEDREYVFYSKKIDSSKLTAAPEQSFAQTANFLQNYIPKKFELRITVIGEKAFAAKIDSQKLPEQEGGTDWRQGEIENLPIEPFDLPKKVERQCKDFLRIIGLNFGCFDFIVTPDDEYYFLECNPNGQWLWVEILTKIPISKAIADFLINTKN